MTKVTQQPPTCIVDRAAFAKAIAGFHKATKDAKDAWRRMVKLTVVKGRKPANLRLLTSGEALQVELCIPCEATTSLDATVDCSILHRALRSRFSDAAKVEMQVVDSMLLLFDAAWKTDYQPERMQAGLVAPPRLRDATAVGIVSSQALRYAAARVNHARSTDETRRHLTGLQVRCTGTGLHFMATDGHRLAVAHAPVTWTHFQSNIELCISADAADLLATLPDGEVQISVSVKGLEVEQGSAYHLDAASLPDGVFHCEQVIPKPPVEQRVTLDARALALLHLACKNAVKSDAALELYFGPLGFQTPATALAGWLKFSDKSLPECHTAIDPSYLLDALEYCHLHATIEYGSELDPIIVRGEEGAFEVIMPRRL